MTYTVNRFSGDFALLEDEDRIVTRIERVLLPAVTREGDVITCKDGEYLVDSGETDARRKLMSERLDALWEK